MKIVLSAECLEPTRWIEKLLSDSYFSRRFAVWSILIILCLTCALRLWRSDSFGIGHGYYSAAAVNMLQSPANFFFVVADAGRVTVDKTPISLWLQSLSAGLIGVSGFALILPSIFANCLSICILYRLLAQDFGRMAGLIAAFVLATTPVSIAVDRSNVADSILILTMLIAAWGFLRAIHQSSLSNILLAGALVGVAFNVKMLQAFIALPAFYAAYFFSAKAGWWRKFQQLIVASLMIVIVSASWLTIVQLTPAEQRPYIGSTRTNSAFELVFGYSALYRFLGSDQYYALFGEEAPTRTSTVVSVEIGAPGPLRFFQKELGNEMAWLLPFAFWSMIILFASSKPKFPLTKQHRALMLWGLWLVAGMIVLSSLHTLHAFYLATLVPALAALIGIGAREIWQVVQERRALGIGIAYTALLSTLAFQYILASNYPVNLWVLLLLSSVGIALLLIATLRQWQWIGISAYLFSLLLIPFVWGLATAIERFDVTVPVAYEARDTVVTRADLGINLVEGELSISDLVQRDENRSYDLVVSNQGFGAHVTMLTDLRVLYLGGFSGNDPIYSLATFAKMLEAGEIAFVLETSQDPEIMSYVATVCTQVRVVIEPHTDPSTGVISGGAILYQC